MVKIHTCFFACCLPLNHAHNSLLSCHVTSQKTHTAPSPASSTAPSRPSPPSESPRTPPPPPASPPSHQHPIAAAAASGAAAAPMRPPRPRRPSWICPRRPSLARLPHWLQLVGRLVLVCLYPGGGKGGATAWGSALACWGKAPIDHDAYSIDLADLVGRTVCAWHVKCKAKQSPFNPNQN